jgi:hypothetical protein
MMSDGRLHDYIAQRGCRTSSGSLAMFTAIRRAGSPVSSFAADRRPATRLPRLGRMCAGRGPEFFGLRNIPDFFDTFPVSMQGVA